MNPDPETTPAERSGGERPWLRPVALVAACLVIGFVGGWVFRGDDGPVTVLTPLGPVDSGDTAAETTGTPTTAPTGTTVTTPVTPPSPPPSRADISLVVLNSTDEAGLAARVAAQAQSLGYTGVTASNAPSAVSESTAYFRPGQRPSAQRVARDLRIGVVAPLPTSGALTAASPDGTDVTLVLGPG